MTFQFQLKTVYLSKFWNHRVFPSVQVTVINFLTCLLSNLVFVTKCSGQFIPTSIGVCVKLHLRRHKVLTQNKDLTCVCAQFRTHPSARGREDMVLHSWGKVLRDKTAVTRCLYNFTKQKASFNSLTQLNLNLQNPNDATVVDHVLKNWLALT